MLELLLAVIMMFGGQGNEIQFFEVVQEEDGMLLAVSMDELQTEYLLDDVYEIGSIVLVAYNNDDILFEQEVTDEQDKALLKESQGDEQPKEQNHDFKIIEVNHDEEIAVGISLNDGITMYNLDDSYKVGDVVNVTYINDDIIYEQLISYTL